MEAVKIAKEVSREEIVVDVPKPAVNAVQEKDPDTLRPKSNEKHYFTSKLECMVVTERKQRASSINGVTRAKSFKLESKSIREAEMVSL